MGRKRSKGSLSSSPAPRIECPVVNVEAIFPRQHPSALSVLGLGLASLIIGPIAGVPAILLGRLVLREIEEADKYYHGVHLASPGVIAGWIGTLGGSCLLLYWTASWSAPIGPIVACLGFLFGIAVLIGLRTQSQTSFLFRIGAIARSAPLPLWAAIGGSIAAGGIGYVTKLRADEHARIEAEEQCKQESHFAEEALSQNRFPEARSHFIAARDVCRGSELESVLRVEAQLPALQTAYREKLARDEAERRARLEAEREAEAAERFDKTSVASIQEHMKNTMTHTRLNHWEEAKEELGRAQAILDGFKGTRVWGSTRWIDLANKVEAEQKRIEPSVARAIKAREAAEEAKRRREEALAQAREAAEEAREARRHLRCCDDTLSPTCLCSGSHRGCCSHHGGVCGCE